MRRVNPLRFKVFDCGGTKKVAPDFCHHAYVRSAEPCCNRLIRAFAAEAKIKLLAEDGFPGPRENVIKCGRSTLALPTTAIKGCLAIILPLAILGADYIRTPSV